MSARVSSREGLRSQQERQIAELDPEATLQVPYSVGSRLLKAMQDKEDEYSRTTGCRRVRIVEGGGDKLVNTLGRNNPWASRLYCTDVGCQACKTRRWLKERQKEAKKSNAKLPKIMVRQGSGMCRREGINYSLQCLPCLSQGVDSQYKGESSRSGRQRLGEHKSTLESGLVSNPLVLHSVEVHGATKPDFLAVITHVEPRALYRVCREAVLIGNQPQGPRNMNRCSEWGSPRIPILSVRGGDGDDVDAGGDLERSREPGPNPRPEMVQVPDGQD